MAEGNTASTIVAEEVLARVPNVVNAVRDNATLKAVDATAEGIEKAGTVLDDMQRLADDAAKAIAAQTEKLKQLQLSKVGASFEKSLEIEKELAATRSLITSLTDAQQVVAQEAKTAEKAIETLAKTLPNVDDVAQLTRFAKVAKVVGEIAEPFVRVAAKAAVPIAAAVELAPSAFTSVTAEGSAEMAIEEGVKNENLIEPVYAVKALLEARGFEGNLDDPQVLKTAIAQEIAKLEEKGIHYTDDKLSGFFTNDSATGVYVQNLGAETLNTLAHYTTRPDQLIANTAVNMADQATFGLTGIHSQEYIESQKQSRYFTDKFGSSEAEKEAYQNDVLLRRLLAEAEKNYTYYEMATSLNADKVQQDAKLQNLIQQYEQLQNGSAQTSIDQQQSILDSIRAYQQEISLTQRDPNAEGFDLAVTRQLDGAKIEKLATMATELQEQITKQRDVEQHDRETQQILAEYQQLTYPEMERKTAELNQQLKDTELMIYRTKNEPELAARMGEEQIAAYEQQRKDLNYQIVALNTYALNTPYELRELDKQHESLVSDLTNGKSNLTEMERAFAQGAYWQFGDDNTTKEAAEKIIQEQKEFVAAKSREMNLNEMQLAVYRGEEGKNLQYREEKAELAALKVQQFEHQEKIVEQEKKVAEIQERNERLHNAFPDAQKAEERELAALQDQARNIEQQIALKAAPKSERESLVENQALENQQTKLEQAKQALADAQKAAAPDLEMKKEAMLVALVTSKEKTNADYVARGEQPLYSNEEIKEGRKKAEGPFEDILEKHNIPALAAQVEQEKQTLIALRENQLQEKLQKENPDAIVGVGVGEMPKDAPASAQDQSAIQNISYKPEAPEVAQKSSTPTTLQVGSFEFTAENSYIKVTMPTDDVERFDSMRPFGKISGAVESDTTVSRNISLKEMKYYPELQEKFADAVRHNPEMQQQVKQELARLLNESADIEKINATKATPEQQQRYAQITSVLSDLEAENKRIDNEMRLPHLRKVEQLENNGNANPEQEAVLDAEITEIRKLEAAISEKRDQLQAEKEALVHEVYGALELHKDINKFLINDLNGVEPTHTQSIQENLKYMNELEEKTTPKERTQAPVTLASNEQEKPVEVAQSTSEEQKIVPHASRKAEGHGTSPEQLQDAINEAVMTFLRDMVAAMTTEREKQTAVAQQETQKTQDMQKAREDHAKGLVTQAQDGFAHALQGVGNVMASMGIQGQNHNSLDQNDIKLAVAGHNKSMQRSSGPAV